ncbi:putative membrane protein [Sulfobacillus acidophilus TPY]|uniref:EamA domain-containing protein n=1 Tax=Sulfobacillus acidophilus (strain ATCC 700253 / DSM 10332 / NAL) TaxID=679936 RepID=G8TUT4_SULAD|nr:putative membrane protein [Sulfobacillus acidophilus TPY]AEW05808.1 protein of unknown function DUF6 transmembrane [Sulfobacillus acidophilus DSM 10332]
MIDPEIRDRSVSPRSGGPRRTWAGLLALALVTAIWGYSNVLIRQLEHQWDPLLLLWVRYALVGLVGIPWLVTQGLSWSSWLWGGLVGAILAVTTLAQAIAMESVSVDQMAFITALYVVLTPLVMAFFRRRRPPRAVMAFALVSLTGVLLLVGHLTFTVAIGTLWSFAAAGLATLQIISTARFSRRLGAFELTFTGALGAAVILGLLLLIPGTHGPFHPVWSWRSLWRLLYLAGPGTLLAFWLQIWGQSRLTATQAAFLFNVEPVWTAVFAWLVLGQTLSPGQGIGAGLILVSLLALSRDG